MTFDPTKPIQTRDGRKARILCIDLKSCHPIVAAYYTHEGNQEQIRSFYKDGSAVSFTNSNDLINVSEKYFINIWKTPHAVFCTKVPYNSKTEAIKAAKRYRGRHNIYIKTGLEIKI